MQHRRGPEAPGQVDHPRQPKISAHLRQIGAVKGAGMKIDQGIAMDYHQVEEVTGDA